MKRFVSKQTSLWLRYILKFKGSFINKYYMKSIFLNLMTFDIFLFTVIWIFFIIYSFRNNPRNSPWGFGIVPFAILVSGNGLMFKYQGVVYLSISASLIIVIFGLLFNFGDIQSLVRIKDLKNTIFLSGLGLLLGFLLVPFFILGQEVEYIQNYVQYTLFAAIIGVAQRSIAEEFLFRGYFFNYLRKYKFNLLFSCFFQASIFTALHIQRYNSSLVLLFIVFLFGVLAGYLTWKSGNLIPSSLMHILVNVSIILWIMYL